MRDEARVDRGPAGRRGRALPAVSLGLLAIAACFSASRLGAPVALQRWWHERGPVVAHDDFPTDCTLCHVGDSWTRITDDFQFDHEAETGVALAGAHRAAECLRCHNDRGPVASFAAAGCGGCHVDPHQRELGRDCALCHGEQDWSPSGPIAEHGRTRFALFGAHAAVACWACHAQARLGDFSNLPLECESCHQADLAAATEPDHQAQGWTSDCQECHSARGWGPGGFEHPSFALTGAHDSASCAACHAGNLFSGLTQDCYACHATEFESSREPDHVELDFSTECNLCHDTIRWQGAPFVHTGIERDCVRCHLIDFERTSEPDHEAQQLSLECQQCHGTRSWTFGFDHGALTSGCDQCHLPEYVSARKPDHAAAGYPKRCEECHLLRSWHGAHFGHEGVGESCLPCHLEDYLATSAPPHAASGYPDQCVACHETRGWRASAIRHEQLSDDCFSCHVQDFQHTSNPSHEGLGYSHDCTLCHSTRDWRALDFQHDFPIEIEPHLLACSDCHLKTQSFVSFSCTHCHAHRKNYMASVHKRVRSYAWLSSACYHCHPNSAVR